VVRRYTSGLITAEDSPSNVYLNRGQKIYSLAESLQYIDANIWPMQGYANTVTEFMQLLVIGGGGGGNNGQPFTGGGGGAGGVIDLWFDGFRPSPASFTVVIGAGAAAAANGTSTTVTSPGIFGGSLIALGGGSGGATFNSPVYGNQEGIPGGSGGGSGGSSFPLSGGSGSNASINSRTIYARAPNFGQGNNGGAGLGPSGGGGGGGWSTAGTAGAPETALNSGGPGGLGYPTTILGTSNIFAAGGGGGAVTFQGIPPVTIGFGGYSDGGGWGAIRSKNDGFNANTYGSGGGGGAAQGSGIGAAGGQGAAGVVVFRFSNTIAFNNLTITAPGSSVARFPGNVVYKFHGPGSISW